MGILGYRFREEKSVGPQKPMPVSQREFGLNLQHSLVVQTTSQFAFVLQSLAGDLNTFHFAIKLKRQDGDCRQKFFNYSEVRKKFDQVKEKRALFRKTIFVRHSNLSREFYVK